MKELFNIQWHKFLVPSKNVLLPYNVINGKLCSLCVISYNLLYLNITKFIGSNKVKIFIVSLIHVTCCSCSFEVKSLPCGARLSISIIELPLTQSLVTTLHLAPLPSVQSEASCSVKKYIISSGWTKKSVIIVDMAIAPLKSIRCQKLKKLPIL